MNRTLWAAVIAATALTATTADARMATKHHRMASGGDAAAQAKTRDLNAQQLASASGAGGAPSAGPGMSPGMSQGSGSAPMASDPAGPSAAPDAAAPMVPPADAAAPADGAAPMDSTTPPR